MCTNGFEPKIPMPEFDIESDDNKFIIHLF